MNHNLCIVVIMSMIMVWMKQGRCEAETKTIRVTLCLTVDDSLVIFVATCALQVAFLQQVGCDASGSVIDQPVKSA